MILSTVSVLNTLQELTNRRIHVSTRTVRPPASPCQVLGYSRPGRCKLRAPPSNARVVKPAGRAELNAASHPAGRACMPLDVCHSNGALPTGPLYASHRMFTATMWVAHRRHFAGAFTAITMREHHRHHRAGASPPSPCEGESSWAASGLRIG